MGACRCISVEYIFETSNDTAIEMISWILNKTTLLIVCFVGGLAVGTWVTWQIVHAGEIKALNAQIRAMGKAQQDAEAKAYVVVADAQAKLAANARLVKQLERKLSNAIPDNSCGLPASGVVVLNEARGYAVPEATTEFDAADETVATHSVANVARFWLEDIASYNECVLRLTALQEWNRR